MSYTKNRTWRMAEYDICSSEPINLFDSSIQEADSNLSSDTVRIGNETETETETKLDSVLVIHPGSANLRIGRVTDGTPEVIPHVIAYKQTNTRVGQLADETLLFNLEETHSEIHEDTRRQHLGELIIFLQELRADGTNTSHPKRLREKNEGIVATELAEESEITSTTLTPPRRFYTGEDALHMPRGATYTAHWPIKRGRFNVSATQSLEMVLQCLEDIWADNVSRYCGVNVAEFVDYKVLLLIPDMFDRQEVKHLVDILLLRLKFASVAVQQSSVCALYSTGYSTACVVDVGDHVTAISCVEDGVSNPNTRLLLSRGGNDVTRAFWWLLREAGFPYKEWKLSDRIDRCLMEELKEDMCHLELELTDTREYPFRVNPADMNAIQFHMLLCDEPILAPLTFFCPGFITMATSGNVVSQKIKVSHPEDSLDDVTLLEGKKELIQGAHVDRSCDQYTEYQLPLMTKHLNSKSIGGHEINLTLDEAIHLSISCSNEQNKQKLYKSVVVAGGGLQFQKGISFLQNRLKDTLPVSLKKMQVDIFTPPREGDTSHLSWVGGTIVASLDTFQEVWIRREEWNANGVRLIRERSPFIW